MKFEKFKVLIESFNGNAYIFDFDDTLYKSKAKIRIIKADGSIKMYSSEEYATHKHDPYDKVDYSEFRDPKFVGLSTPLSSKVPWKVLIAVDRSITRGDSNSKIYILTARPSDTKTAIFNILKKNFHNISINNIITIGDSKPNVDVAAKMKKDELLKIKNNTNGRVTFFDDSEINITNVKDIPELKARLVK